MPDAIGTHWSTPGAADRTTPEGEFFTATLAVSTTAALVSAATATVRTIRPVVKRFVLLVAGGVTGTAAAQWLVSAGLTVAAGDPYQAVLGVWILVIFASFAYGVIPLMLAPPELPTRPPVAHISP